jgi:malonyl-CoA O-methyltransferase
VIQAKKKHTWFHRFKLLEGNAGLLPLASHSVDLIVSNALLPYMSNIDDFFKECHRILKPEGLLMFSSFGPDTFKEWRQAFKSIDSLKHTHDFMDLHDIGDALLKAGFSDPVMDRADICLHYPSFEKMRQSMRKQGIGHISLEEIKSINQEERQRLKEAYPKAQGKYPLTYEVVFGHAWRMKDEAKKNVISLTQLKQLLPSKK